MLTTSLLKAGVYYWWMVEFYDRGMAEVSAFGDSNYVLLRDAYLPSTEAILAAAPRHRITVDWPIGPQQPEQALAVVLSARARGYALHSHSRIPRKREVAWGLGLDTWVIGPSKLGVRGALDDFFTGQPADSQYRLVLHRTERPEPHDQWNDYWSIMYSSLEQTHFRLMHYKWSRESRVHHKWSRELKEHACSFLEEVLWAYDRIENKSDPDDLPAVRQLLDRTGHQYWYGPRIYHQSPS